MIPQFFSDQIPYYIRALQRLPSAAAEMTGSEAFPDISGSVLFYQMESGVLVLVQFSGLPEPEEPCQRQIFAFHIHEGNKCTGNKNDPFADTLGHYNPENCDHPDHAGDLPPIFGNHGYAFMAFLTDRFTADEVIGKTIILHRKPDDFTSQPAGNAGQKIACGEILPLRTE